MKIIRIVPLLAALPWAHSQAIEVAPGDYEPLPAGADAAALYYQHAERKALYADGDRVSDNARLKSDVGILRYIHAVGLADNLVWEPQVLLPFGYLNASGDVGALGDTHGIGDPILAAPLKWTLPTAHGDIFSLAPYLFIPVGSYDKDDALNLGENRWRATLQAAYIHRFTPRLALDTVAEASWVSNNDDFGPAGVKLEEDTRYEYQMALRYALTEKTSIALGGGYVTGAATTVDGVDQHNRLSTSYGRLTVSHFIEPTLQVQAQLGQDFEVEEGFKERARLNLRILKVF